VDKVEAYFQGQERVVLARKAPDTMVGFQWTGAEPEGLADPDEAVAIGAVWEGEELVCYNLQNFEHAYEHYSDEWLEDSD
jgi:hypothetical protein